MQYITITEENAGVRLDRFLRKNLPLLNLSTIYSLIRQGKAKVNSKKSRQDYRLLNGDILQLDVNEAEIKSVGSDKKSNVNLTKTEFFKKNFHIIYEDQYLLACNKPYGLVVHSGTGHTAADNLIALAESYLYSNKKVAPEEEPALVHRLDRDTSGIILIAKNKRTLRPLHDLFRTREISKEYVALCHHRPPEFEGSIVLKMSKRFDTKDGTKMKISHEGMESRTYYEIENFTNDISYLKIKLDTGKTHQIRVHMAHVGAPIIGDERYGDPALDTQLFSSLNVPRRLYLHSHKLRFPHPITNARITLEAPIPHEFRSMLKKK